MLLSHYEYRVTVAPTLAEGVKAFREEPAIIVLDLQLPDGNGLTLLEHIRKTGKSVKVFILSGESRPEVQRQIRRLMPDRCFKKPFNFIEILEAVRATVDVQNKKAAA
jgi:DNA-binding response OmpR family regulator